MTASRTGAAVIMLAMAGCFLLITNLGEPPRPDRIILEVAMLAPLLIWLLSRRLHLRH